MDTIEVASYNMSFAADLDKAMGSEKHRGAANMLLDKTKSVKTGWFNALEKVKQFVRENKDNAFVIGMQEMNNIYNLAKNDNTPVRDEEEKKLYTSLEQSNSIKQMDKYLSTIEKPNNHKFAKTGVQYVVSQLQEIAPDITINYHFNGVKSGNPASYTFPSLLTVWNSTLGNMIYNETLDLCVEHNLTDTYEQREASGRPFTIIFTDEGYTFINLHGINKNGHSKHYIEWLKAFIPKKLTELPSKLTELPESEVVVPDFDIHKLIIMGDFNDPLNNLKSLTLNDTEFSYGASVVKSCCYNYNSSCSDKLKELGGKICETNDVDDDDGTWYVIKPDTTDPTELKLWEIYLAHYGDNLKTYKKYFVIDVQYGQCPILHYMGPTEKDLAIIKTMDETVIYSSAREMADSRGDVKNYNYTGDYILLPTDVLAGRQLAIYDRPVVTKGNASDHEMVRFIPVSAELGGGKNKTRRANRIRRSTRIRCNKTIRNKTHRNRRNTTNKKY
jgi:hypothetical protein